ncbi:hypothetical protein [Nocardia sp. NPDC049707]
MAAPKLRWILDNVVGVRQGRGALSGWIWLESGSPMHAAPADDAR